MEVAIQQIQDSLESFQSVQQDILERLESIEKGGSKSDSSAGSNKSGDNKSRFGSAHNGAKSLHQAIGNHSPANICTAAINSQADPLARVDNSVQDEYKGISMKDDYTIQDRKIIKQWVDKAKIVTDKEFPDSNYV